MQFRLGILDFCMIDLIIDLILNSKGSSDIIFESNIQSLTDKNFIKLLSYLIATKGIKNIYMNDIHKKVSNIIVENIPNPNSDEVINNLFGILRLVVHYEYYSIITPQGILKASQNEKIKSLHQIKMLSLLPFYDICKWNSKYCRKVIKKSMN